MYRCVLMATIAQEVAAAERLTVDSVWAQVEESLEMWGLTGNLEGFFV